MYLNSIAVFILLFLPVLQSGSTVRVWKLWSLPACAVGLCCHWPLTAWADDCMVSFGMYVWKCASALNSWRKKNSSKGILEFLSKFWALSKIPPLSLLPYLPVSLPGLLPVPGVPWHCRAPCVSHLQPSGLLRYLSMGLFLLGVVSLWADVGTGLSSGFEQAAEVSWSLKTFCGAE